MRETGAEGSMDDGFSRIWTIYAVPATEGREAKITILRITKSFWKMWGFRTSDFMI